MDLLEARKKAKELKKKLAQAGEEKKAKKSASKKKPARKPGKKPAPKKAKKESQAKAPSLKAKEEKKEQVPEAVAGERPQPQEPAPLPSAPKEEDFFTDLSFGEDLPEVEAQGEEIILEPEKPSPPSEPLPEKEQIPPAPEPEAEPVPPIQPQVSEPKLVLESPETAPGKDFYDLIVEDLVQYGYAEAEAEELLELLSFQLGEEIYAVPLIRIQQIIKPRPVTYVPRAPEYIMGIISLRGSIIPVFDLKRRLGLGASEVGRKSRIIIIKLNEKVLAGLLVDQVLEVARVGSETLEPTPAVFTGVEGEFIEGIARYRGKMLIVLNLSQVILGRKEEEE